MYNLILYIKILFHLEILLNVIKIKRKKNCLTINKLPVQISFIVHKTGFYSMFPTIYNEVKI